MTTPGQATTQANILSVHVRKMIMRGKPSPAVEPVVSPDPFCGEKRALRCVDARDTGASYRAMATVLFGARRVADEPWKTSSLKAQVARLTVHGRMLVDRGYRRLLRGRPF